SEFDDAAAYRLLQPVARAAADELTAGLQFDERNRLEIHQCGPVYAETVDRNGDIVEPDLLGDVDQEVQIADGFGAVDFNDQPPERRMAGHPAAKIAHRLAILKNGNRQVDREVDGALLLQKIVPILNGSTDKKIRQPAKMRIPVIR